MQISRRRYANRMTTVRPLAPTDRAHWQPLYAGYNTFYEHELDDARADLVWGWLQDAVHEEFGLVAVDDEGKLVGIAHLREYARPGVGGRGLFLDDLFTDPASRGTGVATALLEAIKQLAKDRDLSVVRWVTADDNHTAQSVYNKVATRTTWVTYDMALDE
jgi:GNAT superfamily N-acetyltransferase